MRKLEKSYYRAGTLVCLSIISLIALYASVSAWSTPAPGLAIVASGTNQVSLTVTNGTNTAVYNIYFIERFNTNSTWSLIMIGATGQTNFTNVYDTRNGFFKATVNTNTLPITLTVTIVSPSNGVMIQ